MKTKVLPVFMMVGDEQNLFPRNGERTDNLAKPAIETRLGVVRLETQIHGSILTFDHAAPTVIESGSQAGMSAYLEVDSA